MMATDADHAAVLSAHLCTLDIFVLYACINPKEHGYLGDGAAHR
jgi:hypothetical protein